MPLKQLLLVFITMLMTNLCFAANILITETHNDEGAQLMDLNWRKAANILGHNAQIVHHDYLDSLHILMEADVVILPSGIKEVSNSQRYNLNEFLNAGGSLYVQSEFKMHFPGNQLFHYLVNKNGGTFEWEGELSYNLNPIKVKPFIFENTEEEMLLDYFWNGVYGCGGLNVVPFMEFEEKYFGFLYNGDGSTGRVMTVSDQDWIKLATEVGKQERMVLLQRMLHALVEGIPNLTIPEIQISGLQQSVCPDSGYDMNVNIDQTALAYSLKWYKNGNHIGDFDNMKSFEIHDIQAGDLMEARLTIDNECSATIITSNILEVEWMYPLSMSELSIGGSDEICYDQSAVFSAMASEMDQSMEVQFVWSINGQDLDLPQDTDTLILDQPTTNDTLRLRMIYNDGCTLQEMSASNERVIQLIGRPVPNIFLTGNKTGYCMGEAASLAIEGLYDDEEYSIEWYVNDLAVSNPTTTHQMPTLNNNHEVRAEIKYQDPCKGNVSLNTQIISINVEQPKLSVSSKQHTSCGLSNGIIELQTDGGKAPYVYQWNGNQYNSTISDMAKGQHKIEVVDANGCRDQIMTTLSDSNPKIIDSLVVRGSACDSDEKSLVQLYPNASFHGSLTLLWKSDDGQRLDVDYSEAELAPGNYEVIASVNESCTEVKRFEIAQNDISDQFRTKFSAEVGHPVALDLGIDPLDIDEILWSGQDVLDCTDCTWPTFLADESRSFDVEVTTSYGCHYMRTVEVEVQKVEKLPFFAPNAFTPNNDSKNDLFEFFVDDSIESLRELLIFDRWGNLVFESSSLDEVQWDGTLNGEPVTTGMFIYVVRLVNKRGEEVTGNGTLMLIR
ncbi:MAG: gliding motility-associated C-terminal domain-containing protein [Bacteroidia bacterium]|nr:gliding motility-associated C-terminal domain-containing protein [Bacteroidia bacterium]